ncbi:MAG: WD40 repeat domain-containing protein [Myxacorys chilensis ATA2-1-KO14]|jgi:WD40 repeat protein|nr:WD40 repeat domain-containing protein [Myxacorys chilensis ATA2-1-KO14]
MVGPSDNRSISIQESAIDSTLISGNGNQVIIYKYQTERRESPTAQAESISTKSLGANPYKGLLAFQETDADRYFGRETEIHILWEKLRSLYESEASRRLLPIYGPSGSGKSSLVRAGLIPELARQPLPGRDRAQVAVLVPGVHPLESLATVLARAVTRDVAPVAKTREFKAELQQSNEEGEYDGLRRIASALPAITTSPLIVLVDQFEEVYSLCEKEEERNAFIANLLYAAVDRCRQVLVIVTLRSDFLGQTQEDSQLNHLFSSQGFLVPAMSEEDLQVAIAKPAEQAGYTLDGATIQLLIEQTEGREGALPLLQFALTQIWEGLIAGVAPATTLEQIGGVGGALAGEAHRVYDELTEKQKVIARHIFLGLIQLGEGTRDTRRRVGLDRLRAQQDDESDFRTVLNRFSAPGVRLITLAAAGEETDTAEVTHESLFEYWQQLNVWLNQGRDDLRFQRRLQDAAQHWDNQDRPEGLLWRPPDLDLLKKFYQRASSEMTPLELEFFRASDEAIERGNRAIKRQRRRTIVGLAGGLVSALILASISGVGWWRAVVSETNTRLRSLAVSSEALLNTDKYPLKKSATKAEIEARAKHQMDALIPAIKAGKELKHAIGVESSTRMKVLATLQQAVYGKSKGTEINLPECELSRGGVSVLISRDEKTITCTSHDGTVRLMDGSTGQKLNTLKGNSEWINDVRFSPDGKTIAFGTAEGNVKLWDRKTRQVIKTLNGNPSEVNCLSFSADGKTLAAGKFDGTISLWDLATGEELKTLNGHSSKTVKQVFFSPDSQTIASISFDADDSALKLWNSQTFKELKTIIKDSSSFDSIIRDARFSADSRTISYVSGFKTVTVWDIQADRQIRTFEVGDSSFLSPDGKIVASGLAKVGDNTVIVRDASTGSILKTLSAKSGKVSPRISKYDVHGPYSRVSQIGFSPAGKLIAVASRDHTMTLWNLNTGEKLKTFEGLLDWTGSISFSPDGKWIATSGGSDDKDQAVQLWDISTGKEVKTLIDERAVFFGGIGRDLHFSPDSQMIAVSSSRSTATIQNIPTGNALEIFPETSSSQVSTVRFSLDHNQVSTANPDGTISLRNSQTGKNLATLKGHSGQVNDINSSRDGKTIVSGGTDGTIRVWESATGKQLHQLEPQAGEIFSVSFSPDSQMIAAASSDNRIRLWSAADTRELRTLQGESQAILQVGFSSDGQRVFAKSSDGLVEFWNTNTGQKQEGIRWERSLISTSHLSNDLKSILTVDWNGAARQRDLETGKEIEAFKFRLFAATRVHISNDGQLLAAAIASNDMKIWNIKTGEKIQTLRENLDSIERIQFSPNNKTIAVRDKNNTVELWDVKTGQTIKTLEGYLKKSAKSINSFDFSPDSNIIAFANKDGTISLWDLTREQAVQTLKPHSGEVTKVSFSPDGKTIVSESISEIKLWDTITGQEIKTYSELSSTYGSSISDDGNAIMLADLGKIIVLNLDLDDLLSRGCNILRNDLKTNPNISEHDKKLCDVS